MTKNYLPCTKCDLSEKNANGLFTCNGCEKDFCLKHIIDHKNELENNFEQIINEYNLVNNLFQEYRQKSNEYAWQRIVNLRKDLNKIKLQIDEKYKSANFSEKYFQQWTKELYRLKNQLNNIDESVSFIIQLINFWRQIEQFLSSVKFRISLSLILLVTIIFYFKHSWSSTLSISFLTFDYSEGPIILSTDGKQAEHIGQDGLPGTVRIGAIISKDIHRIYFSFDQLSSSNTFIGIKNAQNQLTDPSSLVGWWIGGREVLYSIPQQSQIYRWIKSFFNFIKNNTRRRRRYAHRYAIESHDILELELDCINSKITLKNQRTNQQYQLDIDLNQTSLPWQIIFQLDHHSDHLRLF